jgi:putative peptidoglycan lipid II flippase
VITIAWASVIGAGLQTLVQLPTVLSVAQSLRVGVASQDVNVRQVVRNFVPAFFGRGVVQVNAFVDQLIASYLPIGAVSLLSYSQTLTILPISLFGMSIAASELPEMSSSTDDARTNEHVRSRLTTGLDTMAFFVVPCAVAFVLLGDVLVAMLYQHGRFTAADTRFTWGILAASGVGLLASAMGRLYSSAFYALQDTRTPVRYAIVRVVFAASTGWVFATRGPALLGIDARWGAAALALASALAGWVEFSLLRSRLRARVSAHGLSARLLVTLWLIAVAAGVAGFGVKVMMGDANRFAVGVAALGTFGVLYFAATAAVGVDTARKLLRRARLLA